MLNNKRGFALLMVLWILTILMIIVLSFSFMTRTETHATLFFREGAEKRLIAEAGVQRGIMELLHRGVYRGKQVIPEGHEVVRVDGTRYISQIGPDHYVYSLLDESGKININLLTDISGIILNNLLVNLGVQKETADAVVDSILDWKDGDELHRLHGAESDYYMSLPIPYKSKNENFSTIEELIQVRGVTREMLYGSREKPGIFNFLTVNSKAGGVNLNTAPIEVLAALPGMTPDAVTQIINLRGSAEIKTAEEIRPIVGEGFTLMAPYVGASESNVYMVRSLGYKKGEREGFPIMAVITMEGVGSNYQCNYFKAPGGIK